MNSPTLQACGGKFVRKRRLGYIVQGDVAVVNLRGHNTAGWMVKCGRKHEVKRTAQEEVDVDVAFGRRRVGHRGHGSRPRHAHGTLYRGFRRACELR